LRASQVTEQASIASELTTNGAYALSGKMV